MTHYCYINCKGYSQKKTWWRGVETEVDMFFLWAMVWAVFKWCLTKFNSMDGRSGWKSNSMGGWHTSDTHDLAQTSRHKRSVPWDHCFASLGCQTVTLGIEFSIHTSHPCKFLIVPLAFHLRCFLFLVPSYLYVSLSHLVFGAGCGIRLYRFLIIAVLSTIMYT